MKRPNIFHLQASYGGLKEDIFHVAGTFLFKFILAPQAAALLICSYTNEEQRQVGVWCGVHLCHTCQLGQNGSTQGCAFTTSSNIPSKKQKNWTAWCRFRSGMFLLCPWCGVAMSATSPVALTWCMWLIWVHNPTSGLDLLYVAHASIEWCMQKVFIKTTLTLCCRVHNPPVALTCCMWLMHPSNNACKKSLLKQPWHCVLEFTTPSNGLDLLYVAHASIWWCMQKVFNNNHLDIVF